LPKAHAAFAGLKDIAEKIPNQGILINALGLQETKDSSAIENIITTYNNWYKSGLNITACFNMVRETNSWEEWTLGMIEGIEQAN
jgi:hypothetical protein